MKRSILLILIFTNVCYGQIKNSKIEYGINIGENDDFKKNNEISGYYLTAMEGSKDMTFELNSNKSETSFELLNSLTTANNLFSKAFSGYKGVIYLENDSSFFYESYDDIILGKYVLKKEKIKYNWQIEKENKTIEGFLCYKATTTDIVVNEKGTFSYPVIAWFCPQIPISSGPLAIGGLPGLILELNRRNIVYGAKKIILNSETEPKISKPDLKYERTLQEIAKMKEEFLNSKD